MNTTGEKNKLDEKLWMVITVMGDKGMTTVDVLDYALAEDLDEDLTNTVGAYEIVAIHANFAAAEFISEGKVLDTVFDVLVLEHLTVGEWSILEAWAYIQATPIECETSELFDGMNGAYFGTYPNMTELAKDHVKRKIDTRTYDDLIMSNISYDVMADDILWRGLYEERGNHYFIN